MQYFDILRRSAGEATTEEEHIEYKETLYTITMESIVPMVVSGLLSLVVLDRSAAVQANLAIQSSIFGKYFGSILQMAPDDEKLMPLYSMDWYLMAYANFDEWQNRFSALQQCENDPESATNAGLVTSCEVSRKTLIDHTLSHIENYPFGDYPHGCAVSRGMWDRLVRAAAWRLVGTVMMVFEQTNTLDECLERLPASCAQSSWMLDVLGKDLNNAFLMRMKECALEASARKAPGRVVKR